MALSLVTGPTKEPLTLTQAKAQLRLDHDEDDDYVVDLIKAARHWVEGQTRRAIFTQTWDYFIDNDWPWWRGTPCIRLPLNPVSSVTSIVYVDGNSPNPTLSADDYAVAARDYGSYIVPAYGVDWPTVRDVPNAITVRFVAGGTDCPKSLERAVALLVAHLYEKREPTVAGIGMAIVEVPYSIESLISPYRSGVIG